MKNDRLKSGIQNRREYKLIASIVFFSLMGILAKLYLFAERSPDKNQNIFFFFLSVLIFISALSRNKTIIGDIVLFVYMVFLIGYFYMAT